MQNTIVSNLAVTATERENNIIALQMNNGIIESLDWKRHLILLSPTINGSGWKDLSPLTVYVQYAFLNGHFQF